MPQSTPTQQNNKKEKEVLAEAGITQWYSVYRMCKALGSIQHQEKKTEKEEPPH
jgi:hypothetical protein